MTRSICEKLKRSVEDATTYYFNRGLFENDPPEFEDMDDVFATLQQRAEKAIALIETQAALLEAYATSVERLTKLWGAAAFPANVAEAGEIYDAIDREFAKLKERRP